MTDANRTPYLFCLTKDKTEPKDKILPGPVKPNAFTYGHFEKNTLTLVQNRTESIDKMVGREEWDLITGDLNMQTNPVD